MLIQNSESVSKVNQLFKHVVFLKYYPFKFFVDGKANWEVGEFRLAI